MYQPNPLVPYKSEKDNTMFLDENQEPFLDIIEHPKGRGFRFRYSCEGPSHGGIPGASSDKNKKTYPAVQIRNYTGYARIVVQLVTNEENPRLHPHSLVGKQCQNGICTVQCGPKDMTATFPNLGIQHVTKKNVATILEERYLAAEMQLSSLNEGLSLDVQRAIKEEDRQRIKAKAQSEAKSIDLSVVRLMFIAYLPDANGAFTLMLKPVISDAIFDSKSPNAATLKICRMDRTNGSANGMDEVYLLCDKVQKDDIQVRFYEEDQYGEEVWEAYGDFSPTDVHRQFAIVFRTPRYKDLNIKQSVNVNVQLRRRSDGEVSDPKQFTYLPIKDDPEGISRKRRKVNAHFQDHVMGGQSNGNMGQSGPAATNRYAASGAFVYQANAGGDNQNMKQQGSSDTVEQLSDEFEHTYVNTLSSTLITSRSDNAICNTGKFEADQSEMTSKYVPQSEVPFHSTKCDVSRDDFALSDVGNSDDENYMLQKFPMPVMCRHSTMCDDVVQNAKKNSRLQLDCGDNQSLIGAGGALHEQGKNDSFDNGYKNSPGSFTSMKVAKTCKAKRVINAITQYSYPISDVSCANTLEHYQCPERLLKENLVECRQAVQVLTHGERYSNDLRFSKRSHDLTAILEFGGW